VVLQRTILCAVPETAHRDGRTVRSERTRQALVDALFALLEEGDLSPTAERIAERAGVSERSVFQHFHDREALFQAVCVQQYERIVRALKPVDASLPLPERIDAFCDERARMLEHISPVRRAGQLIEHESDVVAGWLETARKGAAADVERVFRSELEPLERGERAVLLAALVSAGSWQAWEGMRVHQRLGVERARAAMRATLGALVASAPGAG
jgi:TetR/AcrR family transcriptional regulator, regulator of autoinduction and epiphytic fitness